MQKSINLSQLSAIRDESHQVRGREETSTGVIIVIMRVDHFLGSLEKNDPLSKLCLENRSIDRRQEVISQTNIPHFVRRACILNIGGVGFMVTYPKLLLAICVH